jgi:hypothetical protein
MQRWAQQLGMAMTLEMIATDHEQDREERLRFMRIDAETGELLREFWTIAKPALPATASQLLSASNELSRQAAELRAQIESFFAAIRTA